MAETTTRARRDSGDLSALLLPELRKVAASLGIEGADAMKKPDLVKAISDLQAANREAARLEREARRAERLSRRNNKYSGRNEDSEGSDDSGDDDSSESDETPNAPQSSHDDRR